MASACTSSRGPMSWCRLPVTSRFCRACRKSFDRLLRPQSPVPPGTALLETDAAVAPGSRSSAAAISYARKSGHHINVWTDCPTEQLLVFNESYDQGWHALMDGAAVPVLRANAVCQGVCLPAGRHEVQFLYRPKGLILGSVVSGAAILALMLGGFWACCRRTATA